MRRLFRPFLIGFLLAAYIPAVFAADIQVPREFWTVKRAPGVALYRSGHDYVHVISPQEGGALRLLFGHRVDEGLFGTFQRHSAGEWWEEWAVGNKRAFSVVNGQFFDGTDPDFVPLAFSMKVDGKVYEGYADGREYRGKKMILVLGAKGHTILHYSDDPTSLLALPHDDIIVGLSPDVAKFPRKAIPRTFIGTRRDGRTVILSSSKASQTRATRALRLFGVLGDEIMMLDGGTSSHLVHHGGQLVPAVPRSVHLAAKERVPQVIGIQSGVQ